MRSSVLIASVVCGLLMMTARAERVPETSSRDARVRIAPYDANEIYRLTAHVGYQIELELEPGEVLAGQGSGDLEGITIGSHENHLFLKPKAAKVNTNLTVITNRRKYRFDYAVVRGAPHPVTGDVIYVVKFVYPPTAGSGPSAAERVASALAAAGRQQPRNVDYWYCGEPTLKPTAASDDGVHTRIRFAARGDLPALFIRNEDDSESLLNYSLDDGDVIVHRVARRLIVRRGKLSGCIVNQAYEGVGERLKSGTTSPEVERVRAELP